MPRGSRSIACSEVEGAGSPAASTRLTALGPYGIAVKSAPEGVAVKVEALQGAKSVLVPRDSEMMQAGMRAMEKGFGKKPVFIREGGSIPIVGTFQDCLKAPVLLLGYGLPNDNIHSPNEKFHLVNFFNGISTSVHLFAEAALVD